MEVVGVFFGWIDQLVAKEENIPDHACAGCNNKLAWLPLDACTALDICK